MILHRGLNNQIGVLRWGGLNVWASKQKRSDRCTISKNDSPRPKSNLVIKRVPFLV